MAGEDQFLMVHSRLDLRGFLQSKSIDAHRWLKGGSYRTLEDLEKKAEPAQIHGLFWILPGVSVFTSFIVPLCPRLVLSLNHILDLLRLVTSSYTKSFPAVYLALSSCQSLVWARCLPAITGYTAFSCKPLGSSSVVAGWVCGSHWLKCVGLRHGLLCLQGEWELD